VAALLAACGQAPSVTPGPVETGSIVAPATGTPVTAAATSPIDGLVIDLDAKGLSEVTGFTLRTNEGTEIVFRMGVLENGTQFPPGHLAEHMATSSPVRVFFRPEDGDLLVYRIEDAPAP
jgi:hypothetical protein